MLGFIGNCLQLKSIITAPKQWLSTCKIGSIPYWTTSVFRVTDLVTSSASVVRWLTLHSWTFNFWISQFTNEVYLTTLAEESRGYHIEQFVFWSVVSDAAETRASEPLPSKWISSSLAIPAFRQCLPNRCLSNVIKKLRGFSPLANYIDRVIAAGQRS
jgi:hypothetical protein